MSKKMVDFGKIKKKGKSRFGDLPKPEETENNLESPENAPLELKKKARNKTGRIEPLNFKVTPEFKKEFKKIALLNDQKLVELLENCFYKYKDSL